jgi:hypothetical protein
MRRLAAFIILGLIAQGCETAVTQNPPGSGQIPGATANPQQVKIDNDRRWAHAVESAQKAAFIGGIFGGPFGAPASMVMGVIGFTYGMFSADSKIAEEKAQAQVRYQKESDKDRVLESAIEQEIERQRALENQIAGVTGQPVDTQPPRLPPQVYLPTPAMPNPSPQSGNPPSAITIARASIPPTPPPFRNVEVRDIDNDGVPDIWTYYNPQKPGEIIRQEEATKGDGRVDSWSYYKDGQLVRRDVDRKGQGRPDTIYYYEIDKIVREERDETGEGRMTYRASYKNGRIEKVEKDSTGQGRPDLWLFYDTSRDGEIVVKEERDLNGDGVADLWSYYDNGRLVRRDVNAPGLEILSKQDQVPMPTREIRPPANPGS